MTESSKAQETCYLYKSGDPKVSVRDANIRQRLATAQPEPPNLADRRLQRFLLARETLDNCYQELSNSHLQTTLAKLAEFVNTDAGDKLKTTMLVKANINAYVKHIKLFEPKWHTISIHSKECPNFKSAVKLIVNRFTESDSHLVLDRRLTYDFHVLIDWIKATNLDLLEKKLLVVVEDTDGFEPSILRDLVAHMHTYVANHQLDFHLLLNISVPLALIEDNLSQENIVSMQTQVLEGLAPVTSYLTHTQDALSSRLGLILSDTLQEKLFLSEFHQAHKYLVYAVVGHFGGNPLASASSGAELAQLPMVRQVPSIAKLLQTDPNWLQLCASSSIFDLSQIVPELQIGGLVLDVAFEPHYRPLIEQALADPRVFSASKDSNSRNSVPVSVIYQLTRESSVYINIYDLFTAFSTILAPMCSEIDNEFMKDKSHSDKQSMAIFLESITTLKMMGILRDCKRKFECVEKVSWKGV